MNSKFTSVEDAFMQGRKQGLTDTEGFIQLILETEDLNEELKIALENEDYEYAALIRDELKRKKKYK